MPAIKYGKSHKEQLRQTIDRVLPDSQSYEDFLAKMRSEGYEVKEGKHLSFRALGQERFTRSGRLGDYTREALIGAHKPPARALCGGENARPAGRTEIQYAH